MKVRRAYNKENNNLSRNSQKFFRKICNIFIKKYITIKYYKVLRTEVMKILRILVNLAQNMFLIHKFVDMSRARASSLDL
jgi:hypothetical protein